MNILREVDIVGLGNHFHTVVMSLQSGLGGFDAV